MARIYLHAGNDCYSIPRRPLERTMKNLLEIYNDYQEVARQGALN